MSRYRDNILEKIVSIPSYYPNITGVALCEKFIEKTITEIGIKNFNPRKFPVA